MNRFQVSLAALSFLGALSLSLTSQAAVPAVDGAGKPAVIKCGVSATGATINAVHADKIIFRVTGFLPAVVPADQDALNRVPRDTELDIKVLDNPRTVADLRGKVLTFLGAVDSPNTRPNVTIIDVDYSMVCPASL